jgi:hypothetical protein
VDGDGAACTSETSVTFYQTTRRNNPENSHLQDSDKFFQFNLDSSISYSF